MDTWKTIVVGGQSYEDLIASVGFRISKHENSAGIIRDLKKFFSRTYLISPIRRQREVEIASVFLKDLGIGRNIDFGFGAFEDFLLSKGLKMCSGEFALHIALQGSSSEAKEERRLIPAKDFHRKFNDRLECKNERTSFTSFYIQDQIPWYYGQFSAEFSSGGVDYHKYPMIFQKI